MGHLRDRIYTRAQRLGPDGRGKNNGTGPTARLSHVFPQLPSKASATDLLSLAETLVIAAARDEFVREGLDYVDLPESWTRHDLREANIAETADFKRFSSVTLESLDLDEPRILSEPELVRVMEDSASADACGPTLEAAGAAVAFLVARALVMDPALAQGSHELREALDERLDSLSGTAAEQLVKMVTVPLELRQAVERRRDLDEERESRSARAGRGEGASHSGFSSTGGSSGSAESGDAPPFTHTFGGSGRQISMQDVFEHAAKVQAFLKTKEGQQVASVAATVVAAGSQYVKKRKARSQRPSQGDSEV